MSLSGKVAIITGASSGIGAATAHLFASEGCTLSLTGRNASNLEKTKQECIEKGLILLSVGDVTNREFLGNLVNDTVQKFNRIDILINNAGAGHMQPLLDTPIEKFDEIMSTNLTGPIILIQLCAEHLKKTGGNIVNVSSIAGLRPSRMMPVYGVSKAALDYLTDCLALEFAPEVRVNCVNPGPIRTPIFQRGATSDEEAAARMNMVDGYVRDTVPLGRMGESIEVADSIMFLVGDKAKYITGEKLVIDGGRTCGDRNPPSLFGQSKE